MKQGVQLNIHNLIENVQNSGKFSWPHPIWQFFEFEEKKKFDNNLHKNSTKMNHIQVEPSKKYTMKNDLYSLKLYWKPDRHEQ